MCAHHLETLLQGGFVVLRGHATIQKMGEDGMDVHEPGMNCKSGKKAVMCAHHLETLLQGGFVVLRGHATIQKMGEDGMDVAQRQLAAR